jgi:hypothetical protein
MNLTRKQHELIDTLLDDVRRAFPAVLYSSMHESPESSNDIWVHVAVPDEDMAIAVSSFSAIREIDILLQSGYKITILPFVEEVGAIEV